MTVIYLGNHAPVEVVDGQRRALDGKRCTTVHPPEGFSDSDLVHDLTHSDGVWANHSDADRPAWVASTDPELAQVLGATWGCEVRDPEPGV